MDARKIVGPHVLADRSRQELCVLGREHGKPAILGWNQRS